MNVVMQDKSNTKYFLLGLLNGLFVCHCDTSKPSELDKVKVIELLAGSSIKPRIKKITLRMKTPKTQFDFTNQILSLEPKKMNISSTEKLILAQLSFFIDGQRRCFPSHAKLSDLTGYSKSTVIRALDKLVELKLINKKNRSNQYGNTSNIYELFPKHKAKEPKPQPNATTNIPFISHDGKQFACPTDYYLQRGLS